MKDPRIITQNYRDRWSTLPEGEFDLLVDDIVDVINNPGMGCITVEKADGNIVHVAGFSGSILKKIAVCSPLTNQEKPFIYSGMRLNRDQMISLGRDKEANDAILRY